MNVSLTLVSLTLAYVRGHVRERQDPSCACSNRPSSTGSRKASRRSCEFQTIHVDHLKSGNHAQPVFVLRSRQYSGIETLHFGVRAREHCSVDIRRPAGQPNTTRGRRSGTTPSPWTC
jgi:hypothetical protein